MPGRKFGLKAFSWKALSPVDGGELSSQQFIRLFRSLTCL